MCVCLHVLCVNQNGGAVCVWKPGSPGHSVPVVHLQQDENQGDNDDDDHHDGSHDGPRTCRKEGTESG